MNWTTAYILVGFLLYGLNLKAQEKTILNKNKSKDSITHLREVSIQNFKEDTQSQKGKKVMSLGVSNIIRNPTNFTETLRFNSPIALRDYGNGGVSTASFRGTSATNTSVLWNGIPINAIGNGQTDFNSLSIQTTDEIKIISGGSSSSYGSGAIGGAILLNNKLKFQKHKEIQVFSSYGSFNTTSNFAKFKTSNGKVSVNLGLSYNSSKNDYDFIDTRFKDENNNLLKNENANYENYNIDASLGYKINNSNKLYFYTTYYNGDRLFSAGIPNPSSGKERNRDFNQRNLITLENKFNKLRQTFKLAYLTQEYRYFNNRLDNDNANFGKSTSWYSQYNLNYKFSDKLDVSYLMTYENILGYTDQISKKRRKVLAPSGVINYKPFKSSFVSATIRTEQNSDFKVPVVGSIALEQEVGSKFIFKTNLSTNYRVPTYNELFWPTLGNKNLIPETTKQIDIGGVFKTDYIEFSGSYYYYDIKDKILWLPVAAINLSDRLELPIIVNSINPWRPFNLKGAIHKGFELNSKIEYTFLKKHKLKWVNNYTYSNSKNVETNKRLPYVPLHVFNFNLDYYFKNYNVYIQGLHQSEVFITADIIKDRRIDGFSIYNLGTNITLLNNKKKQIIIGGKVNNVFNTLYYFVNYRPNPGRNFIININYKF